MLVLGDGDVAVIGVPDHDVLLLAFDDHCRVVVLVESLGRQVGCTVCDALDAREVVVVEVLA